MNDVILATLSYGLIFSTSTARQDLAVTLPIHVLRGVTYRAAFG